MSDVIDRPALEQEASAKSRLRIIDCDVHPSLHARSDLNPFLSKRWQQHLKTYGDHLRTPYIGTTPYPRSSPLIARRDAWPPTGGPPGSDLAFMRKQHLDPLDIEFGILQVLDLFIFSQQNLDFGAAIQRAINEWQVAHWTSREPRLKASILVGQDDTEAAIAEIERCARIGQYVQINISPRANEPLGRHRYWPIYARAEELGLPVGIHVGGYGGHAPTGGGWPSYYAEEHQSNAHSMAATLTSLVIEGVFERFPRLKIVFHRRRLRLDCIGDVADGPAFRTLPQRSSAPQAASIRICAGALLVHDPADRRARRSKTPAIPDRMGWCRPAVVLVGLSALGFRRSAVRVQDAADRS
jgi:predicted TIM-barrel fold metal-dependent hydrolase